MTLSMTRHVERDRAKRLEYIYKNVGVGNELFVVVTDDEKHGHCRVSVTTTGLVIVRNINNYEVITLFIGSFDRIVNLWKMKTGTVKLPHDFYEIVKNNKEHRRLCREFELVA